MSEDAARFRKRATDCRKLAEEARDPRDKQLLIEIGEELEAEAAKIDAQEAAKPDAAPDPD